MKFIKKRVWRVSPIVFLTSALAQLILLQSCSNNKFSVVYKNNKQEQTYQKVSYTDLIRKPEVYATKAIEITGIYKSSVEVSALYPNTKSFNSKKTGEVLWMRFDIGYPLFKDNTKLNLLESYQEFEKINGKKIVVRGKFYPDSKGHLSQYFGTIGNVVYLQVLN
jgi:hypothetical protein